MGRLTAALQLLSLGPDCRMADPPVGTVCVIKPVEQAGFCYFYLDEDDPDLVETLEPFCVLEQGTVVVFLGDRATSNRGYKLRRVLLTSGRWSVRTGYVSTIAMGKLSPSR